MRTIECTSDVQTIKDIIKDEYENVIFDGCPSFDDFEPDTENSMWFMLFHTEISSQKKEVAGLIKLENLNLITWMPHIIIKPEYRGNDSEQWGTLVAQYMKTKIADVNFLIMTPYESAKKYALRMGFKQIGILPNSIKKNGKLMNQYILGGSL